MDVGRAALNRIQKNLVDEANHRGIFDVVPRYIFLLFFTAHYIEVFEIEVLVLKPRHARIDGVECFADTLLEFVLFDHNRIDAQARLELDVVDGLQIRRVSDAEEQALAAFDERQDPVLVQQLLIDDAQAVEVNFYGVEIEEWHAEFVRCGNCNRAGIGHLFGHEIGDEGGPLFFCGCGGFLYDLFRDDTVLNQPPWQARKTGLRCRCCHTVRNLDSCRCAI